MNAFWVEAASFALRWLHVVAAIAWIGESFYFVMLDRSLQTPKTPEPGVAGESWSVHGGGFYHKRKFMPAPPQLPETLHWSKWKSYTTWLSGFALFALLYLLSPAIYLIDPAVMVLSPTQAVALAFAFPLLAWLVYDGLCRLLGFRDAALGVLVALLVLVLSYAATHVFAGRAAFLLVGAALATIMSANVLFVIIPGQKRMVAALARGEAIDPLPGLRGKQRSVHNTYFTLPVVFAMLSNHYAPAFAHEHAWLVLAGFMVAGALIRQFFVLWHSGGRAWWLLAAGAAVLLALFAWLAPRSLASADTNLTAPDIASVHAIVVQRCSACHSDHPSLMASAPKGTMFDHPEQIEQRADLIYQQVAVLRVMPPGNITQLSEAERNTIARWYQGRQGSQND
ncbi:MAG: urate hydroxylase PuuD [Xanthomonadaceae bacterium]|nr:urate hydroxylase PuuD [Xanthomonadaceae bacterium]MDP2184507.1 urate hydroxylase PuuD [Xanthomonadales bacterium]MDZ4378520.1 urate hydroxylase PuuD [Xanthomonadaceae bacterium]